MKKYILVVLSSTYFLFLLANPIMPGPAVNEIIFEVDNWNIEIMSMSLSGNLDLCAISGINGYSEFNDGITFDVNDLVVVTREDLQTPFDFDPVCDSILTYWNGLPFCYCEYGPDDQGVKAPSIGQSLRLEWFYESQTSAFVRYCKDNSPTMGTLNDTTDYKCHVSGYVYDANANSLQNAEISYYPDNFNDPVVHSNEFGHYEIWLHALNNEIQVSVNNVIYLDTLVAIEPGDLTLDLYTDYVPSDVDQEIELPSLYYNLSNYPNPFNPSTKISFQLSDFSDQDLEIIIFNSKGQKVKSIVCHTEFIEGYGNMDSLDPHHSELRMD